MFDSGKNYVDLQSGSDCPDVRLIHGDCRIGLDDSRYHYVAIDLLVYDAEESSGILQRHDASLGNGLGYGFKVVIDQFASDTYCTHIATPLEKLSIDFIIFAIINEIT